MKAIRVEDHGGPETLVYQDIGQPTPKQGEALVKIEAIGVNYIDVYHRTGLYPLPLPFTPGTEAAGTVEGCRLGCQRCSTRRQGRLCDGRRIIR